MDIKIYQTPEVKLLKARFALAEAQASSTFLKEVFQEYAQILHQDFKARNRFPLVLLNNNHPDYLGTDTELLKTKNLSIDDFLLAILKDHGFKDMIEIEKLSFDKTFENAIEALLNGDLVTLENLLKTKPHLIHQKSVFGHKATLLHYTGSNGVEMYRQSVPYNLKEVVSLLLDFGADKNAKMQVYGGFHTTKELMATSAHPWDARIDRSILELL